MDLTQKFEIACRYIKSQLVIDSPFDTGNLALNSIRIVQDKGLFRILIGGEIAPYAIFTNEKWNSSKQNPNEGWIEKSIEKSKPMVIRIMQGSITEDELEDVLNNQQLRMDIRMQKRNEKLGDKEEILKRKLKGAERSL